LQDQGLVGQNQGLTLKSKDSKLVLEDTSRPRTKAKDNNTGFNPLSHITFEIRLFVCELCQLLTFCFLSLGFAQQFLKNILAQLYKRPHSEFSSSFATLVAQRIGLLTSESYK